MRISFIALDRPDLGVAARSCSQHMRKPFEGTNDLVKRLNQCLINWLLGCHKMCINTVADDGVHIDVVVENVCAGGKAKQKSCTRDIVVVNGVLVVLLGQDVAQCGLEQRRARAERGCEGGGAQGIGASLVLRGCWPRLCFSPPH